MKTREVEKGTVIDVQEDRFSERSFRCPSCGHPNENTDVDTCGRTSCQRCGQVILRQADGSWLSSKNILRAPGPGDRYREGPKGQFESVKVEVQEVTRTEKFKWICPACSSSNEERGLATEKIGGNVLSGIPDKHIAIGLMCWACRQVLTRQEGGWVTA